MHVLAVTSHCSRSCWTTRVLSGLTQAVGGVFDIFAKYCPLG